MACYQEFDVESSNVVEWQALTNTVSGAVDTGATVQIASFTDYNGDSVAGETFPVAMPHDTGGTYRATVSSALAIEAGGIYTMKLTATGSGGEVGVRFIEVHAVRRGAC